MLMPPPQAWAFTATNITGTPATASEGTSVTAGFSGSYGSYVTILSALSQDVHYLVVGVAGYNTSGGNGATHFKIAVDPAGGTSWTDLGTSSNANIICGTTSAVTAGSRGPQLWYHLPIWLAAGTSVGIAALTGHTAALTGQFSMYAFGGPSQPSQWWCGRGYESNGALLLPGNSGAFSSWLDVLTPSRHLGAIQPQVQILTTTATGLGCYWQVGTGGQKRAGTPTLYTSDSTAEVNAHTGFNAPIFCDVAPGTILQMRGTCSGTGTNHQAYIVGVF